MCSLQRQSGLTFETAVCHIIITAWFGGFSAGVNIKALQPSMCYSIPLLGRQNSCVTNLTVQGKLNTTISFACTYIIGLTIQGKQKSQSAE